MINTIYHTRGNPNAYSDLDGVKLVASIQLTDDDFNRAGGELVIPTAHLWEDAYTPISPESWRLCPEWSRLAIFSSGSLGIVYDSAWNDFQARWATGEWWTHDSQLSAAVAPTGVQDTFARFDHRTGLPILVAEFGARRTDNEDMRRNAEAMAWTWDFYDNTWMQIPKTIRFGHSFWRHFVICSNGLACISSQEIPAVFEGGDRG